jgi:hypothetical protein
MPRLVIGYFRPKLEHKIQLSLTPQEAAKFLEELDAFESADREATLKVKRLVEKALAAPVSGPVWETRRYSA